MAVYTHVSAEALGDFLTRYDVGDLVSAKGIAEGVENSNYMVDTTQGRFFLTLYEKRVAAGDLPFFIALLDHLSAKGCLVPRMLPDRAGVAIQTLEERPACLIEFLPGVSLSHPTPAQAHAAGAALAEMHVALADFDRGRENDFAPHALAAFAAREGFDFEAIRPGLNARVADEIYAIAAIDATLPAGIVHGDLFPDNVLMIGDHVTGLIDFYFAARGMLAWDLAVMHGAWAFDVSGAAYDGAAGDALIAGYESVRPLSGAERAAMPLLARSGALRFLLTRAWDWLYTPSDALVTRKDPIAYLNRLDFYAANPGIFA
ncbi:homoserine kinase [Sphingomonas bacterium]|uniref:homoserine kinase n=1 Tax=Sphingomonas bacterium TaxID=1895847 RepID=UPI0026167AC1|nr:homoserine kinase [Sphingomonas bacterium]MDB5677201.1 homoserine kinase [Sphingomonas bacterium]